MKNIWSIACRNSVIDQDTNSLSLFESFEGINVSYKESINLKEIKIIPISFHIVSLWTDEKTEVESRFDLLVEIIDWQGKVIKKFAQECIIPVGKKKLRAITKINGFGFTDQGEYKIVVKYKDDSKSYKKVSELPIDINIEKVE